jgi:hypothetical protein
VYIAIYVQGSGKAMAVLLETSDKKEAWKKIKKMKETAEKRGFRWSAYKILFDDGHSCSEVYRWDDADSPLIANR